MKPGLSLKLSQHLTLTPQLQQSIRLLQLSTLELNQELERFLQENPLLERDEPMDTGGMPPGAGESSQTDTAIESLPHRQMTPRPSPIATSSRQPAMRHLAGAAARMGMTTTIRSSPPKASP